MRPRVLLLMFLALVAGCQPQRPDQLHIADSTPMVPSNPAYHWVQSVTSDATRAGFRPKVFGSSVLGSDIEREEQTILGLLQINVSSGEDVMRHSDLLRVLRLPFVFDSAAELRCLVDRTDLLARANAQTEPHGLTVIGIVFVGGMSGLFTSEQAVRAPADLAGLRVRALDRTQVETLEALGAAPVKVPWEEIQAALQTGIASGYVNPPSVALQFRHQRDLNHFLALEMFPGFRFVTASTRWLNGIAPHRHAAIMASLARNSAANFALVQARQQQDMKQLEKSGIAVTRLSVSDRDAFAQRAQAVYGALADASAIAQVKAMLARECKGDAI